MKKVIIGILAAIAVVLAAAGGCALYGSIYVATHGADRIPDRVTIAPNELGTVTAVGRGLYDENGNLKAEKFLDGSWAKYITVIR